MKKNFFQLIHEQTEKTNQHDASGNQNNEINQLVFDVIYMLRVHLLELSKLKKLVEKFTTKYTGISLEIYLKGMQNPISAALKKTISRDSEFHSLSDSDDDSFLDDIYASNFPITATAAFFPGPYLPPFPPILDPASDAQNKNPFPNAFNVNEKFFYEQQNNYLLACFAQSMQHNLPTTTSSSLQFSNATVKPSSKKE